MNYFFFISICLYIFFYCFCKSEINNFKDDKFPLPLNESSSSNSEVRRMHKRSVSGSIQLNKLFLENNRLYKCQINVTFLDSTRLNQSFILQDDISNFDVQAVSSNANKVVTYQSMIQLWFNYTDYSDFFLSYNFILNNLSSRLVKEVSVLSSSQYTIVTDSGCLKRANFTESVRTNSSLIWCCILSIVIVIIIFIIIWFKFFRSKIAVQYKTEIKTGFTIQKYCLLLEDSQKYSYDARSTHTSNVNTTTFQAFESQDIDYNIFEIDVAAARDADLKLKSDFKQLNDVFFTIWINSISQDCPDIKDKLNQAAKQIINERENIRKKYENLIILKAKEITKPVVEVNKNNLSNLKMTQDSERAGIMQLVQPEDQKEVEENLKKVFENETRNMVIRLKVKQDQDFEDVKMKCQADMLNEINMTQMSLIKTLSTEYQLNQSEIEDIIKSYVEWQEKLQCMSESEKIRQATAMAYLLEKKRNHAKETEDQNNDINELLETKVDHFETKISEFEENDEISKEMCSKILDQFEQNRQNIIQEMEISKENQVKSLLERLNESKRKAFDDLRIKQENELNNLMSAHSTDTDVKGLIQELVKMEVNHCEEVTATEEKIDDENNDALLVLLNEIGTQTIAKIDENIAEISSELKREGFSEDDVKEILDESNKKIKKIQKIQEKQKEKQKKLLESRLENIKKEIEEDALKQLKKQNNILSVQNDVLNEIMSMQKTLSDDERNKIMEQFTKNKYSIETNLASSRLLQKRKIEELFHAKMSKDNAELTTKFDHEIKDMYENSSKNKKPKNNETAISKCALEYVKDKVKLFNYKDSQKEIDKQMKKVKKEILEERAFLIHKKEEEIAALLNKIQILKATEHVELKEQQDKLLQLQIVALDSIDDGKNVQGIMKKHNQEKEKLNDAIYLNKKHQEERFKRRREKAGQKSLLIDESKTDNTSKSQTDLQRIKQNMENEILQNNLKSENDKKQFRVDFLKSLISTGNFLRSELLEVLRNTFPLKTNQEIETIAEEIYPKSQENVKNQQPQKSLVESLKKLKENNRLKDFSRPGSSLSIKTNQLKVLKDDYPQQVDSLATVREDSVPRKKKKKYQTQEIEDKYDDAF